MNKMLSCTLQFLTRSLAMNTILPRGKFVVQPCLALSHARSVHITSNVTKEYRIGNSKIRAIQVGKDVKLEGENAVIVSGTHESFFPDIRTHSKHYDGIPYNQLPIVNIKSTPNNTVMTLTDAKGLTLMINSAGIEGFKNTKKGTNIAAQQTATTFCKRIQEEGFTTLRLRIQGIGPGRMGALKGFQLSQLNIVSITDDTRVSWNPPRPRKQRRI